MTVHNVHDVLDAMRAVVAAKGADYVYPQELLTPEGSCQYVVHDEPACIVGHVLARLEPDTWRHILTVTGNESALRLEEDQCVSPDAARVLVKAQSHQDGGSTWGDALFEAEFVADGMTS